MTEGGAKGDNELHCSSDKAVSQAHGGTGAGMALQSCPKSYCDIDSDSEYGLLLKEGRRSSILQPP